MDASSHHTRQLAPDQYLSRWRLQRMTLETRWQPPLQLLSVTLSPAQDGADAEAGASLPVAPQHMTLLAWLSCEKASRELALDDPLQAELAMAIMTLKTESLRKAAFQDARPAGSGNVTPLPAPAYSMK